MSKGTINKVILIGRLGADPILRYTPEGIAVANFNLATDQAWKSQEGEVKTKTDWHSITAWRKLAEFCGEYLKKGSLVYVEGRLETSSYTDEDGNKKYSTKVLAEHMQILGPKAEQEEKLSKETIDKIKESEKEGIIEPTEIEKESDIPF